MTDPTDSREAHAARLLLQALGPPWTDITFLKYPDEPFWPGSGSLPLTHIVTALRDGVPYSASCRLADMSDPNGGRDLQLADYHAFQLERNHRGGITE